MSENNDLEPGEEPQVPIIPPAPGFIVHFTGEAPFHPMIAPDPNLQDAVGFDHFDMTEAPIEKPKVLSGDEIAAMIEDDTKKLKYLIDEKPWIVNTNLVNGLTSGKLKNWKTFMDTFAPILDALFPELWQIQFNLQEHTEANEEGEITRAKKINAWITILYKEVFITARESAAKHKINDLYVRFLINENLHMTGKLQGVRGKLTFDEYSSDYAHSHLSPIKEFTEFCKGSTTLVDITTMLGQEPMVDRWGRVWEEAPLLFEAFLHQVDAYVSHEATNGNPYKRIANIGRGDKFKVNTNDLFNSLFDFVAMARINTDRVWPIVFVDGVPLLVYNADLEVYLLKCARALQFKDDLGNMYSALLGGGVTSIEENPSFKVFSFRGEEIRQKITYGREIKLTDKKKYCHEDIRDYIIRKINNKIKSRYAARSIEERYVERGYPEGVTGGSTRKASSLPEGLLEALQPIVQDTPHGVERSDILPPDLW